MLYLFNTTIMPNEGVYVNRKVTAEQAADVIMRHGGVLDAISAIGHQASAEAFNTIFTNLKCQVNRIQAVMQPGDEAIALKLLGRLPEGAILTIAEMQAIGYELYHITNLGASFGGDGSVVNRYLGYLAEGGNSQQWVHRS